MRRAAAQALRTARRPSTFLKVIRQRSQLTPSSYVLTSTRSVSSRRDPGSLPPSPSASSMYFRRFSVALVSTLVATGAYYGYKGQKTGELDVGGARGASTDASPTVGAGSEVAAEATRKALVVEPNALYTGTFTGKEPLTKDTDDYGRKVLEMLTPDQVDQKLRRNEESYLVNRGTGVVRYDVVQIPSNDPIEDDHAEKIVEVPTTASTASEGSASSDWMFWGVFDGHSGWTTSAKLRQVLISFVARELNNTYTSALPSPEAIDNAIKAGFVKLDYEIVHESVNRVNQAKSKRVAAELLAPALSGSCALLSFYDTRSKLLRVACTGDSRAVLGRRGPSGKWTATPLSEDQTGGTPSEAERLRREHPGEPNVVRAGRVLGGLEPTRAFGDAGYKWSLETQQRLKENYFGARVRPEIRTPPYVTAEPVVTTTQIRPEKGDFVVMATDGLWEMLTNEEAVGLVGQWLDAQAKNGSSSGSWMTSWFASSQKGALPVEHANGKEAGGQREPVRRQQWGSSLGENERFVVEDKNAATHLVRNALGGKDKDQVSALLTLPSPYSRRYRDDLTVEVIFFGEGNNDGSVVQNREASAQASDAKPKL